MSRKRLKMLMVSCGMWDVGCGMWDVGCGMQILPFCLLPFLEAADLPDGGGVRADHGEGEHDAGGGFLPEAAFVVEAA